MKTIIALSTALFCLLFISKDTYAQMQPPVNIFYDKTDGVFKQDGGALYFSVSRHQEDSPNGVSKQGILVKSSNSATPVFYVRTDGNQPNKYVMDANKTFSVVYTSQNSLEFRFPGTNVKFSRTSHRVTLTYSENFYVDADNKIELRIYDRPGVVSADKVRVTFATNRNITWWKGIKVMGKNNQELSILEMQDNDHGPKSRDFATSYFEGQYMVIEIWKAKAFGVHTFMEKHYLRIADCIGKEVSLFWVND